MKHKVALATTLTAVTVAGSIALTMPQGNAATTAGHQPPAADGPAPVALATSSAADLVAKKPKAFFKSRFDRLDRRQVVSQNGLQYVVYERTYRGLPVHGGDAVVVTDSRGRVLNEYVAQEQALSVPVTAKVSAAAAARTAQKQLVKVSAVSPAALQVVAQGAGVLAYEVVVAGAKRAAGGVVPSNLHVFVDATTGKVLPELTRDDIVDAAGHGAYYGDVTFDDTSSGGRFTMSDPKRPGLQCGGQNGVALSKATDSWGGGAATDQETGCVDAMFVVSREWDMLHDWLGRNGIDGNGHAFPIREGLNDVNAFWNGSRVEIGHSSDGRRLLNTIDVLGHEFGHAINQFTPGGSSGGNEAGGMNESTGDIFGALTEFFANNPLDKGDYTVGELANLTGNGPIRNMADPSKLGDPNCFSSAIPNTEVHSAAGPQNHWFYLLAEGSRPTDGQPVSPTCNNSTVTGVGIRKAGQIYMATLMRKTTGWNHAKARAASVAAAAQLFGNGTECATVKAAWDAVSVPAGTGEPSCTGAGTPVRTPTATPPQTPTATPSRSPATSPTSAPAPSGACQSGFASHATGQIGEGATVVGASFTARRGRQTACLAGPSGTDFDLYLDRNVGGRWTTVAKSTGETSREAITFSAAAGTYRYRVVSYAGSGKAVLGWNAPA
ncbi:zinc metalloprotease (elastase)-like protein [Actinoplanes sp. SE50/110]|uniref:M4 family metallopeptidase n=1 Tax=Actinoplanes sp. (strain ATCC 31044 / CBS 674.73 / SE50/110) TaxID=134676 RepID=UPI00023EBF9D|nr:M4 family metallopeptidase [Actinoplanes sp. SE50/110]AEV86923.1 zinc metalloprotease (elastase)-like protein [Actinoplanes sp. SE50/110]SLM02730.1 zinc metalloprotease [Actinoplanes sp. SE50/110]